MALHYNRVSNNNFSLCYCYTEVRDLLRTWREDSERRSKDVVDFWENTLMGEIDRLGNESIINQYTCSYF